MWTNNSSVATIPYGTEQLAGTGAGETDVVGQYDFIEWSTDGMDCYRYYWLNEQASAPVDVTPHIDSITPDRVPIDSSLGISIIGSGFGSTPTVSVAGITASVQSSSATSISVTLNIPPNATGGNHGVTVTVNGRQSNSVNLFVQIPTKLRRDSISGLQDEQEGCGVTRFLQYTLLDQDGEGAPIDTSGTLAEGIINTGGPVGCSESLPVQMIHGAFNDTVGYTYSPGCPPPFTSTCTQNFTVTLSTQGYAWALSSQNAISTGRMSSGSKFVNINFTQ